MKRVKVFLLACLIIMNTVLLSGCWNYREIDDLAIVAGLAIDKSPSSEGYLLTFEIVDLRTGGKEAKIESKRVESEGNTMFDAVRNAIRVSAKRLYWSHVNIVVISQEVAKESILPVLDFINRDAEPREQMHVLVSKEKTARELLDQQSITSDIRAFEIDKMIDSKDSLGKAPEAQVHDIINMLSGEGISVTLPAISIIPNVGEKKSELTGTAIFSQDKLIGFLDAESTKYFLFIKNRIKGGLLTVKEKPQGQADNITLEIFENKTKAEPLYENGKVGIEIRVHTKVAIGELDTSQNVIDEKGRQALKANTEKMLQENIQKVVKQVQTEFGVDAFGFGSTVKKEKPELWKSIKADWNSMFKALETKTIAEVDIKGSGLISKPIKIGD